MITQRSQKVANDPKPNDDLVPNQPKPTPVIEVLKGHEQAKCQVQVMCESGVGFQTRTPLTQEQLVDELETKGGLNKTGYAVIPTQPKPDQVAEVLRVNRQKIIGYLITVLGDVGGNRPVLHLPSDEQVMKVNRRS